MSDWQDMESAPKDGTRILAAWMNAEPEYVVGVAQWTAPKGHVAHWTWDGSWMPDDPDFWKPLPEAPQID